MAPRPAQKKKKNTPAKKTPAKKSKTKKPSATDTLLAAALEALRKPPENPYSWDGKSFFAVHPSDIGPILDFNFSSPAYVTKFNSARSGIFNVVAKAEGALATERRFNQVPLKTLVTLWDSVLDWCRYRRLDFEETYKPLAELVANFKANEAERLAQTIGKGFLEFDDIPYLFKAGDKVVCSVNGERLAGKFEKAVFTRSFYGDYFAITMQIVHNLSEHGPDIGTTVAAIGKFSGYKAINELPIAKLTEVEEHALATRGRMFRDCVGKATYIHYEGQLVRASWWSDKSFRSTGRVMIDATSFKQVDNDQWSNERRASGINCDDDDRHDTINTGTKHAFEIKDEDLYRTYPFLYGFSFSSKQWGRMAVSGLTPIKWDDNAFDSLVLDDEKKELIRALVEHSGGTFEDVISGKGGGIVFLLKGPPGVGKTLSAETVSEFLRRPLYSISVGELGVNPDQLESRLRQILDVATIWGAVLLLDEADIFLAKRTANDIVRNAMVGVFLRLLEYHQGVLFLTTNLGDQIDEAFLSRISVILAFAKTDAVKREKVWNKLCTAAKITTLSADEIKSLATIDLNGRQIKNLIRLSQTLAKERKCTVDYTLVREVWRVASPVEQHDIHLGEAPQEREAA